MFNHKIFALLSSFSNDELKKATEVTYKKWLMSKITALKSIGNNIKKAQ